MSPSRTGTQHATTSVLMLATIWLLIGAAVLSGCGSDDDGDADTASSDTSTPTTTSGPSTELMAQLAADGDDATFEDRYGGEIAAGPSGETVMVYAGRSGTDALLYVCDGVDGTWYGGQVDADGAGTLESTDGQATVTLAAEGEGLAAEFDGGIFDGLTTTLTALEDGIGALLRVEAPAGTETATGGGTPGRVGDGGGVGPAPTGGAQLVTQCGALVATIKALVDEIQAQSTTLDAARQQRDALVGQLAGKTGAQRTAIEQQIANLDALIASIEAQITAIQEQIDDVEDELDACGTTTPPK